MKNWVKLSISLAVTSVVALFAWQLVKYLQQRPWPPELTSPDKAFEAGDTYTLKWLPATTGPQAEFYYLEISADQNFSYSTHHKTPHQMKQTPQESQILVAPAVTAGGKKYYCRVRAGYKSKFFSPDEILSDPSNIVSITIKPLPDPAMLSAASTVFSGQEYTIAWTPVNKANSYLLQENKPDGSSIEHKLSASSKLFTAPPLKQTGTYAYKVKAANASGSKWVDITGWSNQQSITVQPVDPPPKLTVTPASVYNPQQYKVSWDVPSVGPKPSSSYTYGLRETRASQPPAALPLQGQTHYTAVAPKSGGATTIDYEVMAYFGKNPMTLYSSPVQITITAPPAPPAPQITSVVPKIAPAGATVTIKGKHLATAKVALYSASTKQTVAVKPKSQSASNAVFTVPAGASLKTTAIRAIAGNKMATKPFQVARQAGSFVKRQGTLKLISQNCGQFKAEIDLPPNYLNEFTGRFKESATTLVNFPAPGFKGTKMVTSGLGFSQKCKVGILVAETNTGIVQPAYINFYNLNQKQDSKTSPGDMISGPNGIEPSTFYVEAYHLLFSPDETIAAIINRNKLGPTKLWIYVIDLLTGKPIHSGGFDSPSYQLTIDKTNNIAFQPGSVPVKLISIPVPG